MTLIFTICLLAFILSTVGTKWYIISTESFLDHPKERQSAQRSVVSGGGIAFFVVFSLGMASFTFAEITKPSDMILVILGAVLVFLGRIDDRWGVSAKGRLLVHLVISVVCSYHLVARDPIFLPFFTIEDLIPKLIFSFLLVGWFINLFNFMDGCDGLVASVSALSALFLASLCFFVGDIGHMAIFLLLAVCLLGFIRYNWERAKVFMGDSGSCFLGFFFAYLALSTSRVGSVDLVLHAVVLAQFIFDPTYTMVFRLVRKKPIFKPHREFAFHQVMIRGVNHRGICYYHLITSLVFLIPLAIMGVLKIMTWWVIMLIVFFALLPYQLYFTIFKGIKEA